MSFPRYSRYSDTGLEWLGLLPRHWAVRKLKFVCECFTSNVDKKSHADEELVSLCNYTDVYYNETIVSDMAFMRATASPEQISKFTLRAGDTIITKDSETADDIAIAAYVPEDLPAVVCGYHLALLRPRRDIFGAFVKRVFDSAYARSSFAVSANGLTRVGLGQYEINNFKLPLPPPDEQREISNFLDRETTKIDALVAEQQRLVKLLKEKRQAVISHAVTKGLNPDAPMKPSGIEWLGDVPAHWQVRTLSSLTTKITNGYVGPTRDILQEDGTRYLQSLHIKSNRIIFDVQYFVSEEWSRQHSKSLLKRGDVLIVQTGDIGQAAVVPEEFAGCNCHALIVVSPLDGVVEGEWLSWVLNSDYGHHSLLSIQTGALHPHLNCGDVKSVYMPVPPVHEQLEIVRYVQAKLDAFDRLVSEAELASELLKERRTALISAAVTGQVDVRDLAKKKEAA
jgi:type I restriction enzyme, S subunit